MGRQIDPFKRPSFTVRHLVRPKTGKKRRQLTKRFLMAEILDVRSEHLGIGPYLVLQRHGEIDDTSGHPSRQTSKAAFPFAKRKLKAAISDAACE
jgi:hypothetical protein